MQGMIPMIGGMATSLLQMLLGPSMARREGDISAYENMVNAPGRMNVLGTLAPNMTGPQQFFDQGRMMHGPPLTPSVGQAIHGGAYDQHQAWKMNQLPQQLTPPSPYR